MTLFYITMSHKLCPNDVDVWWVWVGEETCEYVNYAPAPLWQQMWRVDVMSDKHLHFQRFSFWFIYFACNNFNKTENNILIPVKSWLPQIWAFSKVLNVFIH